MKVFFQGGGIGGFVDSWPETLVPSASNLSTPEWSLVDSVDPCHGRFDEKQLRASLDPQQPGLDVALALDVDLAALLE